jgi:hypothetical protein
VNTDTPKYGHGEGDLIHDEPEQAAQMVQISDVHLEALVQAAAWRYTEPIGRDENQSLNDATEAAQAILDSLKPRCGAYFYPDTQRCTLVEGHDQPHESKRFIWQEKKA